jgi:hypothetical protein
MVLTSLTWSEVNLREGGLPLDKTLIKSFFFIEIIQQCIDGISKYIQRSMNDLHTNSIAFRILCDSISLKITKLDSQ